ncbi:MAG: hypothetical protein P8127_15395 [Acidobacteriota bacterium]
MRWVTRTLFFCTFLAVPALSHLGAASPTDDQLAVVRQRIGRLQANLDDLSAKARTAEQERQKLDAELELADARVHEVELLLERSGGEVERLRMEAETLAADLDRRKQVLDRHLEVMMLLGRPGPLQLFIDAYRGGVLEEAIGTVSVLTAGQARLFEEYREIRMQHTVRLAELSRTLGQAHEEARDLEDRRQHLEDVRSRVANHLASLERSRMRTGASLADLREREASLER